MDEEDFRIKIRPKPKSPRTTKSSWEIKHIDAVRYRILRDPDEFVLKFILARDFNTTETSIGQALTALEKEGLVVYKSVDPKLYPTFSISHSSWVRGSCARNSISWYEGKWIIGDVPVFSLTEYWWCPSGYGSEANKLRRKSRSRRQFEKFLRSNPPEPSDWNGKAYFIIRGDKFLKACKKLGIPSDPCIDWCCPYCNKKTSYYNDRCHGCEYKKLPYEWPVVIPSKICPKCGVVLPVDKKLHTKNGCNINVVTSVMSL